MWQQQSQVKDQFLIYDFRISLLVLTLTLDVKKKFPYSQPQLSSSPLNKELFYIQDMCCQSEHRTILYLNNILFPNVPPDLSINLFRKKTTLADKLINLLPRWDLKATGRGLSQTSSPNSQDCCQPLIRQFELVYQLPTCARPVRKRSSVQKG